MKRRSRFGEITGHDDVKYAIARGDHSAHREYRRCGIDAESSNLSHDFPLLQTEQKELKLGTAMSTPVRGNPIIRRTAEELSSQ